MLTMQQRIIISLELFFFFFFLMPNCLPGMKAPTINVMLIAEIFIAPQINFSRRRGKRLIMDKTILNGFKNLQVTYSCHPTNIQCGKTMLSTHTGGSRKEEQYGNRGVTMTNLFQKSSYTKITLGVFICLPQTRFLFGGVWGLFTSVSPRTSA